MRQWMTGFLVLAVAVLAACTWVEPDRAGREIAVADPRVGIEHCRKLGEVTVSVKHSVAGIERNRMKVRDELESLARNEAATMNADTVQALAEPVDGEQRFGAYDCP